MVHVSVLYLLLSTKLIVCKSVFGQFLAYVWMEEVLKDILFQNHVYLFLSQIRQIKPKYSFTYYFLVEINKYNLKIWANMTYSVIFLTLKEWSTDTTFYGQTLAAHITSAAERQLKKQTFS